MSAACTTTESPVVDSRYLDAGVLEHLRSQFETDCYVRLPAAVPPPSFNRIRTSCEHVLTRHGSLRDFTMPGSETPRRLRTVRGENVMRNPAMAALYDDARVLALLRGVVGESLFPCTFPSEKMVLNCLDSPGYTHGGHLDDPQIALLIIIAAPTASCGGNLEFIPHWRRVCRERGWNPSGALPGLIDLARAEGLVRSAHHDASDLYILHASEALHWVTPLNCAGARRIAVNLAYQTTEVVEYGDSARLLYCDAENYSETGNYSDTGTLLSSS